MDDVRSTLAVVAMLNAFLKDVAAPQYGYGLMQSTGFSSGKVYQILARLVTAGWLERRDDPSATPETGGPPRITYTLRPEAVPMARRMVHEARAGISPTAARNRNPTRKRAWNFLGSQA